MKHNARNLLPLLAALFGLATDLAAGDDHDPVVPSAELTRATSWEMNGPSETTGIGEVRGLAELPLDGEFEGLEGCVMRVREITLLPGGKVAVHQHNSRPGVAYVVEGEAVEHRNDADGPMIRQAGMVAVERSGTVHWWENVSEHPAKVVVVDIVRLEE